MLRCARLACGCAPVANLLELVRQHYCLHACTYICCRIVRRRFHGRSIPTGLALLRCVGAHSASAGLRKRPAGVHARALSGGGAAIICSLRQAFPAINARCMPTCHGRHAPVPAVPPCARRAWKPCCKLVLFHPAAGLRGAPHEAPASAQTGGGRSQWQLQLQRQQQPAAVHLACENAAVDSSSRTVHVCQHNSCFCCATAASAEIQIASCVTTASAPCTGVVWHNREAGG